MSIIVGLFLHVNGNETSFKVLSKEGPSLRDSPIYARFDDGDLDVKSIGDLTEQIQELADCGTGSKLVCFLTAYTLSCKINFNSDNLPSLAVFALAKDEKVTRLVLMSSAISCGILSSRYSFPSPINAASYSRDEASVEPGP